MYMFVKTYFIINLIFKWNEILINKFVLFVISMPNAYYPDNNNHI